ncbi:MAG TPA: hypothetical protein VHF06_34065 [Pseudonocardiaceae bacterium]|nr:hypothetical protein [Pseudonocardiaceae bacterium]
MVGWRDYLRRFRPIGVVGAAAGVPVDRAAEARTELAPLFGLLAEVERETARIRDSGAAEARRRLDDAHRTAQDVVADAEERAVAVRTEAFTQAVAAHDAAPHGVPDATTTRIRHRAAQRLPALTGRASALAVRRFSAGPVIADDSTPAATDTTGPVPDTPARTDHVTVTGGAT